MRRFYNLFLLFPLAIILILLSVANRQVVTFSLDPLNSETPALAFELPFFVFLFIALFFGLVLGGFITWWGQGKHRKALRVVSGEAESLKREKSQSETAKKDEVQEIAPGLPAVSSSQR